MKRTGITRRTGLGNGGKPLERRAPLRQAADSLKRAPLTRSARLCAHPRPEVTNPASDASQAADGRTCVDCDAPISKNSTGRCKACAARLNGEKAVAARQAQIEPDIERTCEQCGELFKMRPGKRANPRRFCSRKCMGLANRQARICKACGGSFWKPDLYAKTCSPECHAALRTANATQGWAGEKAWKASRLDWCELCGRAPGGGLFGTHVHHVVYRQHVRAAGGNEWDTDNGMTLCFGCHAAHHNASQRIPVSVLSAANRRFAESLLGADRAAAYLDRHYAPAPGREKE